MFSLTRENRIIFADTDFHTGLSGSPNSLNLLSVKKIISIEEIAENVICIRKYAVCALLFRIAASESFLKKNPDFNTTPQAFHTDSSATHRMTEI